ncbi:terminase gpA endonuclease subunit [Reyranella sp.]|uniref:terminase gpA endonuclease subunit n=1 Tax=Reyranella sp. TaxID=1929291 RepID=UPI003BAADF73
MPFDQDRFRVGPLATAAACRGDVAGILLPPPDLNVAEAAELYRVLDNPQAYSGPWRNALAPNTVGPMVSTTDPRYEITVYVGPAQSAKTEIGLNCCAHSIRVDPADFQIVLPEKQQAEDFSERRLGRMIRASAALSERLVSDTKFMSVFDQNIVNLSWPTSANASSKPVPRNWLDERDSMDDDIDGEGDPVALYHKRSQTFGPRRHTLVTSSPKRSKVKGAPRPSGKHEAVTTTGILALYNEGTRCHMYWPCLQCGEYFVTRVQDLQYPEGARADDARIPVVFACPSCGMPHDDESRSELFARSQWVAEGEEIAPDGTITGARRITVINSFRAFGPQAPFITLQELVRKKLKAEEVRQKTGSDTELRTFWNVDAGEVYESDDDGNALSPSDLLANAADLKAGIVPAWAPLLVASVDVQSDRFEIMWKAFGPGEEGAIVDHTKIVAVRTDGSPVTTGRGSGGAESAADLEPCDPAGVAHHWRSLVEAVFDRPLPLEGEPGRGLRPAMVAIDTGGKAGSTERAYAFGRWLRRHRPDLARRVMFVKGARPDNPLRVWRSQWDPKTATPKPGSAPRKAATLRAGIDLWLLATDLLKDAVANRLRRAMTAKGRRLEGALHVARDLPPAIFEQLCAESRDTDGHWENERRVANEGWDLAVYCHAAWIRLGGERIDWQRPPTFAVAARASVQVAPSEAVPAPVVAPAPRRRSNPFRFGGHLR